MDLKDALNTIGLPKTASAEEFKTKYRELAKKYHPDIYKDDPEKFKKINEAYQLIQEYQKDPDKFDRAHSPFRRVVDPGGFGIDFEEIFSGGMPGMNNEKHKTFTYPPLNTRVSISFKESLTGANADLKYKKYMKCITCSGQGSERVGNGCKSCNGFGQIVSNTRGMIYTKVCTKCFGKDAKTKPCVPCNSLGVSETDTSVTIHIPPGTANNSTLRLRGAGHFVGSTVFGDASTDVYVFVNVSQEDGLTLDGVNVVSHINLSLLDALQGCDREVKTAFDDRIINIPAQSKNKDEIHIHGCGVVSAGGIQRVVLDIDYPLNTDNLIKYLKNQEN